MKYNVWYDTLYFMVFVFKCLFIYYNNISTLMCLVYKFGLKFLQVLYIDSQYLSLLCELIH